MMVAGGTQIFKSDLSIGQPSYSTHMREVDFCVPSPLSASFTPLFQFQWLLAVCW